MRKHSKSILFLILASVMIVFASLACSFGSDNGEEDLSVQQTIVALQITQTAMANAVMVEPEEPSDPPEPPDPPEPEDQPPDEEPADIPQENPEEPPDVVYEGISFSFDPQIAGGIFPATVPGQNMGDGYMPSETYPTHFDFSFSAYAILNHFHNAKILVYPVAEYRSISSYASNIIDNLQQTMINKPSGGAMSGLPLLPMWNAAQLFSSNVTYFDFKNGSGVRFLSVYGQDVYPVDNQNLFYTYQGLTSDGRFYIAAILPITNFGLPDDGATVIGDYMAFHDNWDTYIADTITWLNVQVPANFFPDISNLDAMMASFEINR